MAVADEIAQQTHDLEDGLRAGSVAPRGGRGAGGLAAGDRRDRVGQLSTTSGRGIRQNTLIRGLIRLFVTDVVETSAERIGRFLRAPRDLRPRRALQQCAREVSQTTVWFSREIEELFAELKTFIYARIINQAPVNRQDWRARKVVTALFGPSGQSRRSCPTISCCGPPKSSISPTSAIFRSSALRQWSPSGTMPPGLRAADRRPPRRDERPVRPRGVQRPRSCRRPDQRYRRRTSMIVIASDHAGVELQGAHRRAHSCEPGTRFVTSVLRTRRRWTIPTLPTPSPARWPRERPRSGILICGTGIGMSMAANRHPGVRAALCHDAYTAEMARRHNDANVLCIGARCHRSGVAEQMVRIFLDTAFEGGRHQRRVDRSRSSGRIHDRQTSRNSSFRCSQPTGRGRRSRDRRAPSRTNGGARTRVSSSSPRRTSCRRR